MNKTGLVLKTEKRAALLVTSTGEFVKVVTSSNPPKIGETYTGAQKRKMNYLQYLTAAVSLFLIIILSGSAYLYYTPVAAIEVNINPSIELKTNCLDRIIKVLPLNADGKTLLKNMNLKNKKIDEGLTLVIEQAKKDNFINNNYIEQGKTVSIKISSNSANKFIKLDKFQKYIDLNKINTNIYNNEKLIKHEFIEKQLPSNDVNKKSTDNPSSNDVNKKNTDNSPAKVDKGKDDINNSNKNINNSQNIFNKNENNNQNSTNESHNSITNAIPNIINKDSNTNESIFNKHNNKAEDKTKPLPSKKK